MCFLFIVRKSVVPDWMRIFRFHPFSFLLGFWKQAVTVYSWTPGICRQMSWRRRTFLPKCGIMMSIAHRRRRMLEWMCDGLDSRLGVLGILPKTLEDWKDCSKSPPDAARSVWLFKYGHMYIAYVKGHLCSLRTMLKNGLLNYKGQAFIYKREVTFSWIVQLELRDFLDQGERTFSGSHRKQPTCPSSHHSSRLHLSVVLWPSAPLPASSPESSCWSIASPSWPPKHHLWCGCQKISFLTATVLSCSLTCTHESQRR